MATLQKCHKGSCGPCRLCMRTEQKYTHVEKFSKDEYALLLRVENIPTDKHACICYSCSKQIKRNINNPNFQPRWKPKNPREGSKCNVHMCTETISKHIKLASVEEIEQVLEKKVSSFLIGDNQVTAGLCRDHYNTLYSRLHPPLPCESCSMKPHKGQSFNIHCPSPDIVNTYLRLVSNEPSELSTGSLICLACYKHFCIIISNIKGEVINKYSSDITREVECETNKEIQTLINDLHSKADAIKQSKQMSEKDLFELVMHRMGIRVGECMKSGEAMLLPVLYKEYKSTLKSTASQTNMALIDENIPSSRWFLSNLQVYYEGMLEVHCRHRRYGTILFHKKCDLVRALSAALGKQHNSRGKSEQTQPTDMPNSDPLSISNQVSTVAQYLNSLLHERARILCTEFNGIPERVNNFNLSELVTKTNPILLDFLRELTQSVRQSRRKLFQEPSTE